MGVGGGSDARVGEKIGAVFSLSLVDDCPIFLDLLLPNIDAKLVDDFVFFDVSKTGSSSCDRLRSIDSFSFALSLPSDRSDTVLSVFLCRPFLGLELRVSCDCLRGEDGRMGRFSSWLLIVRCRLCGWSGGSSGAFVVADDIGM